MEALLDEQFVSLIFGVIFAAGIFRKKVTKLINRMKGGK